MVVPIFTNGDPGPRRLAIPAEGTGPSWESVLFCEELTTLHEDFLVDGPLGRVEPALLGAVLIGVRRALGDYTI